VNESNGVNPKGFSQMNNSAAKQTSNYKYSGVRNQPAPPLLTNDSPSKSNVDKISSPECESPTSTPTPSTYSDTPPSEVCLASAKNVNLGGSGMVNNTETRSNSATSKLTGSLRWIIYSDHIDDYAEMLCTTEHIRVFVVNQCAKHSSTHSACIKWSKKWNLVNHPSCAKSVYYAMSQQSKRKKASQSKKEKKEVEIEGYHDLPMCTLNVMEEVLFVNDATSFEEARDILLAETKCIGLDLECMIKKFPVADAPKYCQILQISTTSRTVIFDLESIPSKYSNNSSKAFVPRESTEDSEETDSTRIDPGQFDDLLYKLLYNGSLLKVGMSFDSDIKALTKQYPYFKSFKCIVKSYFELGNLLSYLRTKPGQAAFGADPVVENRIREALKKTNFKREGGLATVVRHVLKKRLNKREQLSNWGHRPLRLSQLEYAAIDSAIEVSIYEKLQEICPDLITSNKWITDLYRF